MLSVFCVLTGPQLVQTDLVNKSFPGVNIILCSKSPEF